MTSNTSAPGRTQIAEYFQGLQDDICRQLEVADGSQFHEDAWNRPGGGGGRTRILQGRHIEKGGVNYSGVHGELPKALVEALGVEPGPFFACGVSIVLHPANPHVPIIHMNVRYFETAGDHWWFGGGIDLTPHYVIPAEAGQFHRHLKGICDRHHPDYYPTFKVWADDYFYLRHRAETRGVGGIFFDRLGSKEPLDKKALFAFVKEVGEGFCPAYLPLLERHKEQPFSEKEKQWQYLRRGRYVEFNLVWDRGTKFGLDTSGRTESILMSLPPMAGWAYAHQPQTDSAEANTLAWLRKGVDWISEG